MTIPPSKALLWPSLSFFSATVLAALQHGKLSEIQLFWGILASQVKRGRDFSAQVLMRR